MAKSKRHNWVATCETETTTERTNCQKPISTIFYFIFWFSFNGGRVNLFTMVLKKFRCMFNQLIVFVCSHFSWNWRLCYCVCATTTTIKSQTTFAHQRAIDSTLWTWTTNFQLIVIFVFDWRLHLTHCWIVSYQSVSDKIQKKRKKRNFGRKQKLFECGGDKKWEIVIDWIIYNI